MYEPILHVATESLAQTIGRRFDSMVIDEVVKLGVVVDKEELLKALEYDRDQYEKGYDEGHADGFEAAIYACRRKPLKMLLFRKGKKNESKGISRTTEETGLPNRQ